MQRHYDIIMKSLQLPLRIKSLSALVAVLLARCERSHAFVPSRLCAAKNSLLLEPSKKDAYATHFASHSSLRRSIPLHGTSIDDASIREEWIPLVDATGSKEMPPVRKRILREGEGDLPSEGATVELEYTGTLLGEEDWSAVDVAECWLSQLQGLDQLAPKFVENKIDGMKLLDESFFTEEYCTESLGISNKIQAKKLVMASKRLIKQQDEHPAGREFDSSASRGKNYSFALGRGKAIKAVELAASSMRVGERALVVCRADYGYGSEGLRTAGGDVVVPPFATLRFELELVSATT